MRQKRRYLVDSVNTLRLFLGNAVNIGECDIEQYYTDSKFKKYVSGETELYIKSSQAYPHGKVLRRPTRITKEEYLETYNKNQCVRKHREMYRMQTAFVDVDYFLYPHECIIIDVIDEEHSYPVLEGMLDITGQEEYRNNKIARRC